MTKTTPLTALSNDLDEALETANHADSQKLTPVSAEVIHDVEAVCVADSELGTGVSDALEGPKQQISEEDTQASAQASAALVVGVAETAVSFLYPMVEYDDDTRETAVEKLVPIFAKYGGVMPPWLAAIQPELKAALFFGGVGVSTYMQIKAAKAEDAANDTEVTADGT